MPQQGMYTRVSALSEFALGLHNTARHVGASDLVAGAVSDLADLLGFDSAWYGWAQVDPDETVIHANSTFNLPDHYYQAWSSIAEQDLLADQFRENPHGVPTYDRSGQSQTDGMEYLADAFGLKKMATAMCLRDDRTASFFLSAYRGGSNARTWGPADREFLQCAVDNIAQAARAAAANELTTPREQMASAYVSNRGTVIVGLADLRDRFGHLWSRHSDDRLPRWLMDYVQTPGEYALPDAELVIRCEALPNSDGLGWQKLTLRPLQKIDLLSPREREVAAALSRGQSHKVVAKLLGVAPATIRNQTQSIYRKLGVDNRASLARLITDSLPE